MNNWSRSHQNKLAAEKKARKSAWLFLVVGAFAGVILTAFFAQYLAPLLPGPHPIVTFYGIRGCKSKPAGCTWYGFNMIANEPLDSVYIRLALPQNIKDSRVGRLGNKTSDGEELSLGVWQMERNSMGECEITHTDLVSTEGVAGVATTNVLVVHTSRVELVVLPAEIGLPHSV
ncbi:MAG TPA: hypothetical protein VMP68_33125 [Candidatus Eisenbacteria bacterium]|nr:hypothetical protein [Candidatus Eisenbacteria bacterium]